MNEAMTLMNAPEPSLCPMHGSRMPNADDELVLPLHKRAIVQYSTGADGNKELHLYHGDKEISFDEPELFEFGEQLVKQAQFAARSAMEWGPGYAWTRVRELLAQLVEEGVLQYADTYFDAGAEQPGNCPSPLPVALGSEPRTWLESEAITQELTGRGLELGYLELVIPVFRVAHIVMDAEGRQVGEANVFPKPLRLDIPTNWRTCIYPGSRYLDARPMNVTALKSMRNYWPQMMVALLHIRDAYLHRFPSARKGWTVGDIEALSTLVLALPTYLLMRAGQRVENGQLHPALSSLFRVTDGLRVVTHQMIFVPFGEPTVSPRSPITAAEIYAYAERNYAFSSEFGVCAGPKVMIDEFLNVLVNGVPIKGAEAVELDADVKDALNALHPAFDYGLNGLQAHAVIFSVWPLMTRAYVELSRIMERWRGNGSAILINWRERLEKHLHIVETQTHHATEELRVSREQAYADIYQHCAAGLGLPAEAQDLVALLSLATEARHEKATRQLRVILQAQCVDGDVEQLVVCLMQFFTRVQALLRVASTVQQRINTLLGRRSPERPFDAAAIDIHNLLQGSEARRLPYLLDELEEVFGLRIVLTKDELDIGLV